MENVKNERPIRVVVRLQDILDVIASRMLNEAEPISVHSDIEHQIAQWVCLNCDLEGVTNEELLTAIAQRVWAAKIRGSRVNNIKVSVLL